MNLAMQGLCLFETCSVLSRTSLGNYDAFVLDHIVRRGRGGHLRRGESKAAILHNRLYTR